jgi:hypothetical protein
MNEHQLNIITSVISNPNSVIHKPTFSHQKDFIIQQLLEHKHYQFLEIHLYNQQTYTDGRMEALF